MSQVGTIKGYHDGATYSLANVYDEKLTEVNILAGTSAKELVSVSFNTDTGLNYFVDSDIGALPFNFYQSNTIIASASNETRSKQIIPYLSADHAAAGVALNLSLSPKRYVVIGTESAPIQLIPLTKDSSGNYVKSIRPSFEYDGWFFINTAVYPSQQRLHAYRATFCYAALQIAYNSTTYSTPSGNTALVEEGDFPQFWFNSETAIITPCTAEYASKTGVTSATNYPNFTFVRELDRSVFDRPFHLTVQWFNSIDNPEYIMLCFVDDQLYSYIPRTPDDVDKEYYGYKIRGLYLGTTRTKGNCENLSVTNFKFSILSPVYQKITPSNLPIRHNGAKCYIPLTTNKSNTSAPCLAVRHGSTNYYAIK